MGIEIPTELLTNDEVALREKIERFQSDGANKFHVIFDFDRTLTVAHPETNDDVTTWHIMDSHLPREGAADYQALFEKYRALELAETLTDQDAEDWWNASLNLYRTHRVDMREVERDFVMHASIRPGTAELFAFCQRQAIPTVVFSAGIRDVIEVWSRAYNVSPTEIISTALTLDENGCVTGWDESTLVHVLNKHEMGHAGLTAIRATRPNVILVGDSLNDADMASGDDTVLRIRMFDPRPDEKFELSEVRQKTFQRFDAMIESGSFAPLKSLVKIIATK